ncbi:MAG: hypothetical protein M3442_15415 [Chloroflexota bacterium]|nr:hypothetical protein [Chloroflexota bacterium]
MAPRKRIAALVTEYRIRSHADNIVTRLLEGYEVHWEIVTPRLHVASLYTDQVPADDISRQLAATHAVPIFPTIREALTLGGSELAVDGVVIVAEHGTYPYNEKGQHLYPRRCFFEQVVHVFRESGRVVPVFNDKHLAWTWEDAKWMYDQAQQLSVPFMAGSSLPLSFRLPPLDVPFGAAVEEIVVVAQGGIESYGFHALEIAQCLAERRQGFETGVAAVQCLTGEAFREASERGDRWSKALEQAALGVQPLKEGATPKEPVAFVVEYRDGLQVTILMLSGYAEQWGAAVRVSGQSEPLATWFLQSRYQPVWSFCHQVDHIERLVESGRAPFPIGRTLLTSGLIDAVMTSRAESGRRIETPHLAIAYAPTAPPPHHARSVHPAYPLP